MKLKEKKTQLPNPSEITTPMTHLSIRKTPRTRPDLGIIFFPRKNAFFEFSHVDQFPQIATRTPADPAFDSEDKKKSSDHNSWWRMIFLTYIFNPRSIGALDLSNGLIKDDFPLFEHLQFLTQSTIR
jgi:hypothetical protein